MNRRRTTLISVFIYFFVSLTTIKTMAEDNNQFDKYTEIANKIFAAATKDSSSWERLAYLCDTYGPRLSGSENLNNALKWVYEQMKKDGFQNVKMEEVYVPHWVRGNEYCELISPHKAKIEMLGLGGSIATPREGITAPVIVVHSFDELHSRAAEAKGKIVVYNFKWKGYGDAVQYRFHGAVEASKAGAVASLTRSATPVAMSNPHTGVMGYEDSVAKIPHAGITPESADLLDRLQSRGQTPTVHLYMEAQTLPDYLSYNVMGEIKGSEKPDEIIAMGGHSDSWDVGSGAHDDASGVIATWEALRLIKALNLQPRRTIRAVAWVNEENGTRGGKAYAKDHKDEKHNLVFEFDSGVFPPSQIGYNGSEEIFKTLQSYEKIFQTISPIMKVVNHGGGVDIGPMMQTGVPGMSLNTEDREKYFWYHHSATDTPDKVNPDDLNRCIAAIALAIYIYADLP